MKKMLTGSLIVIVMSFGSISAVSGQEDPAVPAPTNTGRLVTNNIDGIDVPLEVLEYVQYEYLGHAVTKVEKAWRGGAEVYRLRVDKDDQNTDYESIILLYDLAWKRLGDERLIAPQQPKPKENKPVVQIQQEEKPVERDSSESSTVDEVAPTPTPVPDEPPVEDPPADPEPPTDPPADV